MPLQKTPGAAIRQPRIALSGEWIAALDLLGQKRGEPNRAAIIREALLPYLTLCLTQAELESCGLIPEIAQGADPGAEQQPQQGQDHKQDGT
jgi:hypothetical protein